MKCANCTSEAIYKLDLPTVSPVHYCGRCLPSYLRQAASNGKLDLVQPEPVEEVAPKKVKKASSAPDPVSETPEPAVEIDPELPVEYSPEGDSEEL
jgi:hypothetical protein